MIFVKKHTLKILFCRMNRSEPRRAYKGEGQRRWLNVFYYYYFCGSVPIVLDVNHWLSSIMYVQFNRSFVSN